MSAEIIFFHKSGQSNGFIVPNNQKKCFYEQGKESPSVVLYTRDRIGVDIEIRHEVYHLPCFIENSDHMLHAMRFVLHDKDILIRAL